MIETARIKRYALFSLPYAFMFWLFNKCGESYRISDGGDTFHKMVGVIVNLNVAMSLPFPSFSLFDFLIGVIGTAVI